jgi:hypothetical protein
MLPRRAKIALSREGGFVYFCQDKSKVMKMNGLDLHRPAIGATKRGSVL